MNVHVTTLKKETVAARITDFIRISKENIDDEYWDAENFLSDLNKKWDLSLLALDEKHMIVGFLIASEKENSVHIHKFVIDAPFQRSGLGRKMLAALRKNLSKGVTLKVNEENKNAVSFYEKNGFEVIDRQKDLLIMRSS